jgi:hypothetical protein
LWSGAIVLCGVPLLAWAGAVSLQPVVWAWPFAAATVTCAALLAMSLAPGVRSLTALMLAATAGVLTIVLALLHATTLQTAAVIALTAFILLAAAPAVVARLARAFPHVPPVSDALPTEPEADEAAAAALKAGRETRTLLSAWNAAVCAALLPALLVLAASGNVYAEALAACLATASVLESGSFRFLADVLPAALTGATGLFAVLTIWPQRVTGLTWVSPAALGTVGMIGLVTGLYYCLRRRPPSVRARKAATVITALCAVAALPLVCAIWGVFTAMMAIGQRM